MGRGKFLKFLMIAFNGIIILAGAALLGIGIWETLDGNVIFDLLLWQLRQDNSAVELSQVLNMGYVLLLFGSLGCCGAVRESRCMLMLFFVIILVAFIAQVVGAVTILIFQSLAEEWMNMFGAEMVKSIKTDFGRNQTETALWLSAMNTFKCCGFYNYTDFTDSPYNTEVKDLYPPQCCATTDNPCNSSVAASVSITTVVGCFPKIKSLIYDNAMVIAAVALGIAGVEMCAMVVSMTLSRLARLKNRK